MVTEGSACSQDSYPPRSPCLRQRTEDEQDLCSFLLRADLGFLMRCSKYKTPFTGPGVNPRDIWMHVHALLCLCGVIGILKENMFDNHVLDHLSLYKTLDLVGVFSVENVMSNKPYRRHIELIKMFLLYTKCMLIRQMP